MTRPGRIGLLGGECTGKTSLARALADVLPGRVVDEHLRAFVEIKGRPPAADEQRDVMRAQIARESDLEQASATVITDPAPLMTAVYSLAYFADGSLVDEAVAHARGYDLVVWCDIDLPWEPDPGQRDGPEYRARVHDILTAMVAERLEPEGIPVLRVSGSLDQRIDAVTRAWQPGAFIEPT